ncbi:NAD-dependent epimerase/dehydratase family protein [Caulobacter sp. BE254]|uniref:NAD-dependent epimerase/dehydratase family protein n=1 Tax=Caulobacter sp. BE254 TaxID=2817720 RepID=UPI00285F8B19|nr:NAD-dependent epimerase/dehydratase family protein [Caulobacter sp. BE254]MDR7114156.1 nucleoside-diphosphate-sugar epimerase [Caulobacter sp. BE254]
MRRALVTGATGGLGLALTAALLAEGYAVRATGRDAWAAQRLRAMGAETVEVDLVEDPQRAIGLCAGVDVVFHAAALSSPWGRARTFERVNVEMTRTLLDAARQIGCQGLVFVSSPSIYAETRDRLALTEADPPARRPLNAYARTKLAAERLVLAANGPDFFTVAIRPRALVGPDDKVLLPRLLDLVACERAPLPRGGRALVELTDTRDAAHALILADRKRAVVGGRAFNISGGAPIGVRAFALDLAAAMGLPLRIVPAPWPLLYGIATLAQGVASILPGRPEPALTPYGVATLAFSQTFDLTAAQCDLGYAPRHDAHATALELARRRGEGSWP